jgi:DNA-binding NtrC family response regulator
LLISFRLCDRAAHKTRKFAASHKQPRSAEGDVLPNANNMFRGRHILIVEDEIFIAMDLMDTLENLGASTTGPIAQVDDILPAMRGKQPDAVILDLNLQGVSSRPFAAMLIALGIPVVLTTGYAKADIAAQFPGVPIVEKPCDPQDIIAVLSTILMGKKDLPGPADAAKRVA